MFDWLKSGKDKGRARRRSSAGRSSSGKRRPPRRSSSNSTEFMGGQKSSPIPMQDQLLPTPQPLPDNVSVRPDPTPNVSTPPPVSHDAAATNYHPISAAKGSLVGVLIVVEGAAKGELYKVFDGENTIGRGDASRGDTVEIRTDERDTAVSRKHATIIHESGNFGIKPLKEGMNPTFLNGDEVTGGATLTDGDLIRVGNTTMQFRLS